MGGWSHFSAKGYTLDGAHEQCTALLNDVYSESSSSSALPFPGRAGTPLGQASPCLWTGTYFFNFPQSCNFCAFTGTHPSLRHSPQAICCEAPHFVVLSTVPCAREWRHCTLISTIQSQDGAAGSLGQVCCQVSPPRACSFANQRLLWCIGRSNSTWCELICRHGSCLLTKRGSRQQTHRPQRTNSQTNCQYSKQTWGVPNSPLQGLSEYTPYTPPPPHRDTHGAQ